MKTLPRTATNFSNIIFQVAAPTFGLLSLPFITMQFLNDVNWGIFDFVIAGIGIFTTGMLFTLILDKAHSQYKAILSRKKCMSRNEGHWLAIHGIDAVGKSILVPRVASQLRDNGINHAVELTEFSSSPVGRTIFDILEKNPFFCLKRTSILKLN